MIDKKAIGARIHMLRFERGWSLKDLEKASGVSESMLSRYEHGKLKGDAPLRKLDRIAGAFDRSVAYLLDGRDSPSSRRIAA
jgi:transcriptional regulator with XRE-family HTH domain